MAHGVPGAPHSMLQNGSATVLGHKALPAAALLLGHRLCGPGSVSISARGGNTPLSQPPHILCLCCAVPAPVLCSHPAVQPHPPPCALLWHGRVWNRQPHRRCGACSGGRVAAVWPAFVGGPAQARQGLGVAGQARAMLRRLLPWPAFFACSPYLHLCPVPCLCSGPPRQEEQQGGLLCSLPGGAAPRLPLPIQVSCRRRCCRCCCCCCCHYPAK
jgi:hypothetical protein